MNKTELAARVATLMERPDTTGVHAVNAVITAIAETLAAGEEVNITGFGKFKPVATKARTGRNPKTGDPVDIPAKTVVKFQPGKVLKDKMADPDGAPF
jgi:DNA-binding protein HU-beta